MVYKIVFTVDLATCKALNSLQTVQHALHCTTCLFSCLFARFEGVADDPRLWDVHALSRLSAVETSHAWVGTPWSSTSTQEGKMVSEERACLVQHQQCIGKLPFLGGSLLSLATRNASTSSARTTMNADGFTRRTGSAVMTVTNTLTLHPKAR